MNMIKKAARLWPFLMLIACLALSVGVYAVYGMHNLDSDISSEFILAQLLNEEGRVFLTDSWYYSTELRIVSPVPVYQLALRLFGDWHMARTASIAVLLAGVAASMIYMARGLKASWAASVLCASAIILPITEYNAFTLVYGGFYTVCVMLTFIQIGLIVRMRKGSWVRALLLALLGVYGGLNGVRMLMICVAPLLCASVVMLYLDMKKKQSLREMASCPSFYPAMGGLLCTAATLTGYLIHSQVLVGAYDFAVYDETMLCALDAEMFTDQLICLMSFFGYRDNVPLLSMAGVVSVLAVALPVLCAAAIVLLLRMDLDARERLVAVFVPVALLMGMVINVLTLSSEHTTPLPYTVSYYMPAALMMVFALYWLFDRFACRIGLLRVLPMLLITGVFVAGNAVYREEDMNTYPTELEDIAECLLYEEAYEGYATFWNANVLTEITHGEIEVFAVEDFEYGDMNAWLQRKDHFEYTPYGRMFALFWAQDWDENDPGCDSEKLVYASDAFYVVVYDSDEEFRAARNW